MEDAYGKSSTNTECENDTMLAEEIKSHIEPDVYLADKPTEGVTDYCQNLEDDFGPETNVDTLDDAHPSKTSSECTLNAIVSDSILTNGVKPLSLENKIMQHLSEQNKDFLVDTNPFVNDQYDQYSDQSTLESQFLEQTDAKSSDINSSAFVDNKIIDALESLESVISEEKHDNKRTESTLKTTEMADFSEKVDNMHEKLIFSVDPCTDQSSEMLHNDTTNELQPKEEALGTNLIETCAEGSVEEESEEEDEWNYFKADKKPACEDPLQDVHPLNISEVVTPETTNANVAPEDTANDLISVCNPASEADCNQAIDSHDEINELGDCNDKEDTTLGNQGSEHEDPLNLIKQESSQFIDDLNLDAVHVSASHVDVTQVTNERQDQASVCENPVSGPTESSYEEELTTALVNTEVDSQIDHQILEDIRETTVDGEVDRPGSLNLEMASKLNPEAKEFVPTGSPSRSNPSSPSGSIPTPLQNSYLMFSDDTVIAQSPKKGSNSMDNIIVPAENEFQKEMDSRPHELEKSEYLNGDNNPEKTGRSHSPGSEPSYQEMNLKEAMHCDEKLDFEYNDEKQANIEDTPSDTSSTNNVLNILVKEQNTMNMSFYEGRDEALLVTNSDELNKVQILPNDDDIMIQNEDVEVSSNIKHNESIINTSDVAVDSVIGSKECLNNPSFETSQLENETHKTDVLVNESPASTILEVATQVVNNVAALVDEMLIDAPTTGIQHKENLEINISHLPNKIQDIAKELQVPESDNDISVDIDNHLVEKTNQGPIELDINLMDSPADHNIPSEHEIISPSTASHELTSPILETVQQEVVTENEFIMDESVLNVSPMMDNTILMQETSSTHGTAEKGYVNEGTITNGILQVDTDIDEHVDKPIIPLVEPLVSQDIVPEPNVRPTTDDAGAVGTSLAEPITSEVNKLVISKPSKAPPAAVKSPKPAPISTDKKTSTINKPSTKTSSKLLTAPAKPATSPKKMPAVNTTSTSTSTTKSSTVSKSAITSAARTNLISASKTNADKKILPVTKKPLAASSNGETKSLPAPKKPVTAIRAPPTKTSSSSVASSRLTSNVTVKPSVTAATTLKNASSTRTVPSAGPSRTSTATTTRTSTLTTKARTSVTTKSVSTAPTLTSAIKTSQVSSTIKRVNNVQNVPLKTNVPSKNTITKTTITSRTSATSKPGSTPTGPRRVSATTPNKKPSSSPAGRINVKSSPTVKSAQPKTADSHHSEIIPVDNTKGLLDKQLKNDNNELITKNGMDSPVMVIDSAAD